MQKVVPSKIIISRTDSIGDVLLTLPITAWIKENFPSVHIAFLCRSYTAPLVRMYTAVDEVIVWDELSQLTEIEQISKLKDFDTFVHVFPKKELAKLAKKAKIKNRVGTSHRLFHLFTCNIRPNFTRKKSELHEAQLNFELVQFLKSFPVPSLDDLNQYTSYFSAPSVDLPQELHFDGKYICLHPKSQGSAREWPIENYVELSKQLVEKGFSVVFTGTEKEGQLFRSDIPKNDKIIDSTGLLSIEQLVKLIQGAEGIVACSTGPLHIGGFLGIRAVGLFSPSRPIHPGRWQALGAKSVALVKDPVCPTCAAGQECDCIREISVEQVLNSLL